MARKRKSTPQHMKATMVFLSLFVVLGAVCLANYFGGVTGAVTADDVNDELLSTYKDTFNEKADGLPDVVFTFFGDDVVNIYLTDIDVTLYAVLENDKLVELEHGEQENPTFTITTTYDSLVKLQQRDISLSQAIDDGLVSFSSKSYIKRAELATVLYSIDIYEMFS